MTTANTQSSEGGDPRWRARRVPLPRPRRWLDRRLAQADVATPDGSRYHVRLLRNLPLRGSPLGPFDDFLPGHVSLGVLVAANLYTRGRTGWTLEVARPETPWRAAQVICRRRVHRNSDVAEAAIALARAIQRGERPWDDDRPKTSWASVKKLMNWD